jgi:hypothetical protein
MIGDGGGQARKATRVSRGRVHLWVAAVAMLLAFPLWGWEQGASHASDMNSLQTVFSPPEGYYQQDVLLRITSSQPQAEVLFTLDGTPPTETNALRYQKPVRLPASSSSATVVRARVQLPDGKLGPICSATYLVGLQADLPVLSLVVDPDDLWESERGIYVNPEGRGREWERGVEVAFFEASPGAISHPVAFHLPAGLRIHGGTTRANAPKKSFRLYFRQEYGANRLEYPIFAARGRSDSGLEITAQPAGLSSFKRLVIHNGGQDYTARNWTLLRIHLMNDLAEQLDCYTTQSQPVLLYVNGEPWGIFQLRDYVDDWLLADKYGLDSAELLDAPFVPVPGSEGRHWEHLVQFLEGHDLSNPSDYAYVQTQVDVSNLIDYAVLQIFAANNDWLHHNVKQFRPRTQGGRWQWILWDVDYSFGKEWQSFYDFDMIDWLYHETRPNFERGSLLLRRLLDNPEFRAQFLTRFADLLNTVLTPERILTEIDTLAAELRADIGYEVRRWPREGDWETSVEKLREFAEHRPDAVRQNLKDGFGLEGTDALVFNPPASGGGRVAVNGVLVPDQAWRGIYFKGFPVDIVAVPEPGYRFAGWEPKELPQMPQLTLIVNQSQVITPRFEPASPDLPRPGDLVITHIEVNDQGTVEGDWIELMVQRQGGLDLRGWRITDNDTKNATDEGSLILSSHDALRHVPGGTRILVIASESLSNDRLFTEDDLAAGDRRLVLYVGNGQLDTARDPWFNLSLGDNLAILAPGPSSAWDDDQGVAFATLGDPARPTVNSATFGILADGVTAGVPTIHP